MGLSHKCRPSVLQGDGGDAVGGAPGERNPDTGIMPCRAFSTIYSIAAACSSSVFFRVGGVSAAGIMGALAQSDFSALSRVKLCYNMRA